ncbi:SGNH/GDSL hydrolase family protein [Streptacidiphilus sp. P02-A3a]|uniref:SGNH/GDSL hydrolase family protein n=1 Tax=Streptacidiphilus sp. P02-A3a TaxID=2704468 RepID=UPI001CDBD255|nr:SGNH/GDSL hydrolase family protein [Streptacidiphilus sp. P02-A3a]
MSRERVARRIAAAAAYGGGGIGLLGVGFAGLLLTEAKLAEMQLNTLHGEPPRADGLYGQAFAGEDAATEQPLRMAVLGDSTAAGFGVDRGRDTPGALLAGGIAAMAERPVRLTVAAVNGAASDDLERQLVSLLETEPELDIALIMIGANDVTQRIKLADSVRMLGDTVRRLRAAGAEVVVGTCPDLGTIEPVRPPLRTLARRASRQLAAAQTIAVVDAGGRSVSLGTLLGPEFNHRPEMFASDRYHPSAQGYQTAAMALLPSMCAALEVWPEEERPDAYRGEGVLPVARAAAEAAGRSGTEVAGAEVLGADSGPRGRWALLKHRRRHTLPDGATPESAADPAPGSAPESTSDNSHAASADAGAT